MRQCLSEVAAVLLLFVFGLASLAGPELVVNGGMETAGSEPGLARGWKLSWSSGGNVVASLDRDDPPAGTFCQKVENRADGAKFPRLLQSVAIETRSRYRLTAKARAVGRVQLWLSKGGWGRDFGVRPIPPDGKWHDLQVEFESGENQRLDILFMLLTPEREAAAVWVDDVSLAKVGGRKPEPVNADPPAENLVRGKSYEFLTVPNYALARDEKVDAEALTDGVWKGGYWGRKQTVVWRLQEGGRALVLFDLGATQPVGGVRIAAVRARDSVAHPPEVHLFVGMESDTLYSVGVLDAGKVDAPPSGHLTEWCERRGMRAVGRYVLLSFAQPIRKSMPGRGLVCVTEIELLRGRLRRWRRATARQAHRP